MRILFASWPGYGHLLPMVPLIRAAQRGGHDVVVSSGADMSGLIAPAMTAGSIEGQGTYFLGSNALIVGGNNMSTTVSGTISDGGASGGTGGSLVKVGAGILTLSGTNTYTGTTTVNAGVLVVNDVGTAIVLDGVVVARPLPGLTAYRVPRAPRVHLLATGLDADELNFWRIGEWVEDANSVAAATDTGNDHIWKQTFLLHDLLPCLCADH